MTFLTLTLIDMFTLGKLFPLRVSPCPFFPFFSFSLQETFFFKKKDVLGHPRGWYVTLHFKF